MRPIALVFILSLVIIACDTTNPEPVTFELRPSRFEEEDFTREYFYNAANQLIQIKMISALPNRGTLTSTQNFTYLPNGKMAETTSDTGFKFVYSYEGDKILRTDEYVNDTWSKYYAFTYDSHGRLAEQITYQDIPEEGGLIPTSKDTYQYDANDNLEVVELFYYTTFGTEAKLLTTFISSDYDTKMNTEDYFDVNVFNPYVTLRKNNPGKLITMNGSGSVGSTELYTYQYHPFGYATSKTTHITWYHGGTGSYTSTYIFKE